MIHRGSEFQGKERGDSGKRRSLRFPLVTRSIGDRALARQASHLSRPWEARSGEVYAIERRIEVEGSGDIVASATEVGYWKKGRDGIPDMAVSLLDLPTEEVRSIAPFVLLSLEDQRHTDLVAQHIKYHHETRCGGDPVSWEARTYVCLSFWGGMLILEDSVFEEFRPADGLLPEIDGGFGFGFIWQEVSRKAVPDAFLDADIILGKYIADRLYPGIPGPTPPGRGFGASAQMDDSLLL